MSIHFDPKYKINVQTVIMNSLLELESNVVIADQEMKRCQSRVNKIKGDIHRLRAALDILTPSSLTEQFNKTHD